MGSEKGSPIGDGDKYAIIALPTVPLDLRSSPDVAELAPGIWFARALPLAMEPHWRQWLGSVRSEQIAKAKLILLARAKSKAPAILDDENERLGALVGRLYQGLQLAGRIWVDGEVVRITGAKRDGMIDIRQVSTLSAPRITNHVLATSIGMETLRKAVEFVPVLNSFPGGKYLRLCRVLNAFFSGLAEVDVRERLHQFCRSVEGLILPDIGHTNRQFKSRTELFVGPGEHEYMGRLYANRGATEHMNDPDAPGATDRERRDAFLEMTVVSEEVARGCLVKVLLNPNVRRYYVDDATLKSFWSLDEESRRSIWGAPVNLLAIRKQFRTLNS